VRIEIGKVEAAITARSTNGSITWSRSQSREL
jgi:hypothetical protein